MTPFLFVLIVTVVFQFVFLSQYPFVALFDEIRDGGLNTRQILNGEILNIFGWGRYNSHGLIIPVLNIPAYLLFGNSVFAYRFSAALAGFSSIILLYYFGRKFFNQTVAFFSSLLLLTLPFHLYYSRTEIVIAFTETFSLLALYFLFTGFKTFQNKNLIIFGLTAGFTLGLHASTRVMVITSLIFLLGKILITNQLLIKTKIGKIITVLTALFIGYGPRLIFTSPNIFFHTERIPLVQSGVDLLMKYLVSLNLFFIRPVSSLPYEYSETLFPFFLTPFFLVGLWQLWKRNRLYFFFFLSLILILPFTNSAVTDLLVYSHRLIPLWFISSLIIGLGVSSFLHFSFKKFPVLLGKLLTISLFALIVARGAFFFYNETANSGKKPADYLSMYTLQNLKQINSQNVCLSLSPQNFEIFNLLHYQEQYTFFLPKKTIRKNINGNLDNNEVLITGDCGIEKKNYNRYQYCQEAERYQCPRQENIVFSVLIEKDLF